MNYKSWLVTLAVVGSTTAFAVHALSADKSADKGDGVFIDEGDGDFDSMPIPPQGAKAPAAKKSQNATVASEKPSRPAKKSKEEKIADVLKAVPAAPGPAAIVPPAPVPETQADQMAAQMVPEAPPLTVPDEKPLDAATQSQVDAEVGVQLSTKDEADVPVSAPAEAPKKKAKSGKSIAQKPELKSEKKSEPNSEPKKTAKAAKKANGGGSKGLPNDPGLYVTTREACPMKREPASESPLMITVKPAKKIWVQKVEDGKWFRAFNKAGEPGYIDAECVTPQ